jgi:hypothetical protein
MFISFARSDALTDRISAVISDFRRDVDQICALLGYYAASSGNPLSTRCPEISVKDYQSTLRNISEERRYLLSKLVEIYIFFYGSTALYGPGPPRFVEASRSHTFETHHSW